MNIYFERPFIVRHSDDLVDEFKARIIVWNFSSRSYTKLLF